METKHLCIILTVLLLIIVGFNVASFRALTRPHVAVAEVVPVAEPKEYTDITKELVRTDDHERGISCYYFKDWRRALSCAPMRDKLEEQP
jgi:hypothetical protein